MIDTPTAELEARLEAASVEPVDPIARIDALNALAWGLRNPDVPRANALATEARQLSIDHEYKLGQARAARTLCMTIVDMAGIREIFGFAQEARQLFDEVGDEPGRAASRDFLATLYEYVGDLATGLELAWDALRLARALGDPVRQGYALSSVGGILAASGEVDAGVERLEEALELFEGVQDLRGAGAICSRLAQVLRAADRDEEALVYAEKIRRIGETTDQQFLFWSALTVMAEIDEKRGDLAQAEERYRAALAILSTPVERSVIGAQTQIALGRLLMKRGALEEAEDQLEEALAGSQVDAISSVAEASAHDALAELYERQGRLAEAIQHLRAGRRLREKISQRDARNKVAQVEVRMALEAANKDAEIHKLRFVELHGMQSKLVEAKKMALLGKLAAGTAHELNTPLGVLQANMQMSATAIERLVALLGPEGEVGAQAMKLASVLQSCRRTNEEAIDRIQSVAQSFRRFTQLDQADVGAFDVRDGLNSALALLEPTTAEDVRIERDFGDVPKIAGWPRELNHAFLTVVQNAVQAIEGAGVVAVETRATDEHVLVRVKDTGRGMTPEQAAHLFDVSWSEDGTRTQMRLGLSAAYTTVQNHGGTIEVQSTPGEGTTMTFRLPIPAPDSSEG